MVKTQYRKARVQRETSTIRDCFSSTGYRLVSWVRLLVCGLVFIQFSSAAQSCLTLYSLMDCHTPDFPVLHQLLELAQTHIHWVDDAIQPSHPLLSPSPPAFNLSQHQGLFQWVSSSHQVAIVLDFSFSISPSVNIQDWSPLELTGWISLQSKGLSRVFCNTTVQKHQFFGTQLSLWSNSHIHTWLLEKP